MPFKLRLGKKSQLYNVTSKELFFVRVSLLDHTSIEVTLLSTSLGLECLQNVCQKISLQQLDFFGLLYVCSKGNSQWLDIEKPVKKQLEKTAMEARLYLRVMYYLPDVSILTDDVTRYHYFLQLKSQLIDGKMKITPDDAVLLAAYSLQVEFGNFSKERHTVNYLSKFSLFPVTMANDSLKDGLIDSLINVYRNLTEMPSSEAEMLYIKEVQKYEGFGLEGFTGRDMDTDSDVAFGVSLHGILVNNYSNVELYRWKNIANLIHHKKVLTIELNTNVKKKNFLMIDNDYAKFTWRIVVQQHQYFLRASNLVLTECAAPLARIFSVNNCSQVSLTPVGTCHQSVVDLTIRNGEQLYEDGIDGVMCNGEQVDENQLQASIRQQINGRTCGTDAELHENQRSTNRPEYKCPPDYETYMKSKFNIHSLSVGHIPSYISKNPGLGIGGGSVGVSNSHSNIASILLPSTAVGSAAIMKSSSAHASSPSTIAKKMQPRPRSQYANYFDLSKIEPPPVASSNIEPTINDLIVKAAQVATNSNALYSNLPLCGGAGAPVAPVVAYSTPELNKNLGCSTGGDLSVILPAHNVHNYINANHCQPYSYFTSVPNLTEPISALVHHHHDAHHHLQAVSSSDVHLQSTNHHHPVYDVTPTHSASVANNLHQPLTTKFSLDSRTCDGISEVTVNDNGDNQADDFNDVNSNNLINKQTVSTNNNNNNNIYQSSCSSSSTQIIINQLTDLSRRCVDTGAETRLNNNNKVTINCVSSDPAIVALESRMIGDEFVREFEQLILKNSQAKFTVALSPENIYRNRYRNILPYDENRVRLSATYDNLSGYINASNIVLNIGYMSHRYIAAQGPLPNTVDDFWRMVLENEVNLVVMVENLAEGGEIQGTRSFVYYPTSTEQGKNKLRFGEFEIQCNFTVISATYVTSAMTVTHTASGHNHSLYHIRYTDWPSDQKSPTDISGFLSFHEGIDAVYRLNVKDKSSPRRRPFSSKSLMVNGATQHNGGGGVDASGGGSLLAPILVHCSSGIGGSGVVIVCDSLLRSLDYSIEVDVPNVVTQLRLQRMLSVQNFDQYCFIYSVLIHYLRRSRLI